MEGIGFQTSWVIVFAFGLLASPPAGPAQVLARSYRPEKPAGATAREQRQDDLRDELQKARSEAHAGQFLRAARRWYLVLKEHGHLLEAPIRAQLALRIARSLRDGGRPERSGVFLEYARAHAPEDPQVLRACRRISDAAGTTTLTFFRIRRDLGQFDTARVSYRSTDSNLTVVLQGVTHMGTREYYRGIQERMNHLDRVLFEVVIPTADHDPHELSREAPDDMALVAHGMGLTTQTEALDYSRSHYVWADLTVEEILARGGREVLRRMEGEAPATVAAQESPGPRRLTDPHHKGSFRAHSASRKESTIAMWKQDMRRELAELLSGHGAQFEDSLAPDTVQVIIRWRNDRVMEILDQQTQKPDVRTVGILYGAGHMQDLERRLLALGYRRISTNWDTAWTF